MQHVEHDRERGRDRQRVERIEERADAEDRGEPQMEARERQPLEPRQNLAAPLQRRRKPPNLADDRNAGHASSPFCTAFSRCAPKL